MRTVIQELIDAKVITLEDLDRTKVKIAAIDEAFSNESPVKRILLYGGSRCFSPNTLIITEFGIIPIENVQEGDKVLSDNLVFRQVVKKYANNKQLLSLNVNNKYKFGVSYDHGIKTADQSFIEIGRVLETINTHRQPVLDKQSKESFDNELEELEDSEDNYTSDITSENIECNFLLEDSIQNDKWEVKNNEYTCSSSRCMDWEKAERLCNKSQRWKWFKQQCEQFGVLYEELQFATFIYDRYTEAEERGRESNSEINSQRCKVYKRLLQQLEETWCEEARIQTILSRKVQSESWDNKGDLYKKKGCLAYDLEVEGYPAYYVWCGFPFEVHNSGKTFKIVQKIVSRALLYPGSRHLIFRDTYNAVRMAVGADTLPRVLQIKFPLLYKTFSRDFNKSDNIYKLPNGSEIQLAGIGNEEEVERLLGREYVTIFGDEASELNYLAVLKLRTRLAQKVLHWKDKKKVCKLLEIFALNPTNKNHFTFKEHFLLENPLDKTVKLPAEEMFKEQLNPIDNIDNLPDDYIRGLMRLPRMEQERFLYGNYGSEIRGSIFCSELNKVRDHINNYPYNPMFEVFAAYDIGHYDQTSIVVFQYYNKKWRIINHIEKAMESWPYYSNWMKNLEYPIKRILFPHDGNNTDWSNGITRRAQAERDGFQVWIAPRLRQNEQIDIARQHVKDCYFNKDTTERLIECLEQSTYDYDEKTSLYKSEKLKHDEFSHTTSSFIYMITGTLNNIESERYETEEEKNKRLQREAEKAVANAIEHDLEEIFDPGFDLTKVRRDD